MYKVRALLPGACLLFGLIMSASAVAEASDSPAKKVFPNTDTTTFKPGTREVALLSDQYGTMDVNVPCPCVFDKGRYFHQQEINLLGYIWGCRVYDEEGVCFDIERRPKDEE